MKILLLLSLLAFTSNQDPPMVWHLQTYGTMMTGEGMRPVMIMYLPGDQHIQDRFDITICRNSPRGP